MQTVSVTIQVPKESKEVVDAVVGLIVDVRAGKSVSEIISGSLGKFVSAVDGFEAIQDEINSDGLDEMVGYTAQQLIQALRG